MGKITAIVAALQVISKKNFMAMAVPWHGGPAWNGDTTHDMKLKGPAWNIRD